MHSIAKAPLFKDQDVDKARQDREAALEKDKEDEATFQLCLQISQSEVEQSRKVQPLLSQAKVLTSVRGFVMRIPQRFRRGFVTK